MTTEELRREAGMLMAAFKAQVESGFNPAPTFMLHWPFTLHSPDPVVTPGEWSRIPGMEHAGPILDVGPAKTILFDVIREIVRDTRADGVIFGTDAWQARSTPEGFRHIAEYAGEIDKGFEKLVKKGWATREECIVITAQSPANVVILSHAYQRRGKRIDWTGELHVQELTQGEFDGRQKMFACDQPHVTLGEPPKGSPADRHNKGEE